MQPSSRQLTIVEHDPHWEKQYNSDAKLISKLLGAILIQTDHIGATAVHQLSSTPSIDLLAQVHHIEAIDGLIDSLNKNHFTEIFQPSHIRYRLFYRGSPHHPLFLHIHEHGDPQAENKIRFKDYLNQNSKLTELVSRAKKRLADQYIGDSLDYHTNRAALLQTVDIKALTHQQEKTQGYEIPHCSFIETDLQLEKRLLDNWAFSKYWPALFSPEACVTSMPDFFSVFSQLKSPKINQIWNASFSNPALSIDEVLTLMKKNKGPVTWWVTPRDEPKNLLQRLHRKGILYQETQALLHYKLGSKKLSIPSKLSIKKISKPQQFIDFASMHHYNSNELQSLSSLCPSAYQSHQPLEYQMAYLRETPLAGVKVIYYANIVGIYDWVINENHEKAGLLALHTLLDSILYRAFKLGWQHSCLLCSEEEAPRFLDWGFTPMTQVHRHQFN